MTNDNKLYQIKLYWEFESAKNLYHEFRVAVRKIGEKMRSAKFFNHNNSK
jgi:hypothetical protein